MLVGISKKTKNSGITRACTYLCECLCGAVRFEVGRAGVIRMGSDAVDRVRWGGVRRCEKMYGVEQKGEGWDTPGQVGAIPQGGKGNSRGSFWADVLHKVMALVRTYVGRCGGYNGRN